MDKNIASDLHQLKAWWKANPVGTMRSFLAFPSSFEAIRNTEVGRILFRTETKEAIRGVLLLDTIISQINVELPEE